MKSINNSAPVKCARSITIDADSPKVWAVLTNINGWSDWQTDISDPKLDGELQTNATFSWKSGGVKIQSTLHTVEPYKQFGWSGKTMGMYAIHNWKLVEESGKTEVSVEESMEGLLAKIFRKSFDKSLKNGMQTWLELLKKKCEN